MGEWLDARTSLPAIVRAYVRLMLVLDEKRVDIGVAGNKSGAASALLAKLAQEYGAFVSSLRAGSATGAVHHVRAVFEVAGAANYLDKKPKYVEKFNAYPAFARAAYILTSDDPERARRIAGGGASDAVLFASIEQWRKLWKPDGGDLSKVQNWHYNARISDIIRKMGEGHWLIYELICHGVHVSPLGSRIVGGGRPRIFGFDQNEHHIFFILHAFAAGALLAASAIDQLLEGELWEHVGEELVTAEREASHQYAQARKES